jgi:hypothetical protein
VRFEGPSDPNDAPRVGSRKSAYFLATEIRLRNVDAPDPPISNYPRKGDPQPEDRVSQLAKVYVQIEQDRQARQFLTTGFYLAMAVLIFAYFQGFRGSSFLVPFLLLFGMMTNIESTKALAKLFEWDRYERTCFYLTQSLADICFLRHLAMRPIMHQIREEIASHSEEEVETVLDRERQRLLKLPVILP